MNRRSCPTKSFGLSRNGKEQSQWPRLQAALLVGLAVLCGSSSVSGQGASGMEGGGEAGGAGIGAPVLVELFTSQGCSSCPPADRLLAEFARRPEVIAISFAVDYWDYLGWHDTYGSRANSARQRAYVKRMGEGMVYTPQLVIDGRRHLNGADRAAVDRAVGKRLREKRARVALSLRGEGDKLHISVGAAGADMASTRATLWMAAVSSDAEVEVRGGENGGQRLHYRNIVRDLMPIGEWSGTPMQATLPRADALMHGGDSCILILQEDDGGPVLAAARLEPR